ncbi:uncharacterized protein LOC134340688 isoform X3 [Mobula hypostoma]|uniref:uncharacterized protein LOC134340688 isoform X3 n=1 Tax=Mobula hypostoma TaxID=723540 RepID=UPI002FC2F741
MQFYKILGFIVGAAFLLFGSTSTEANFRDTKDGVFVSCDKDTLTLQNNPVIDPSYVEFTCGSDGYSVYVKTMKNTVNSLSGMLGLVIASIISTIFIGLAVYSLSSQNRPRTYQASDRHPLMRNDVNEAVYSHLNQEGQSPYSQLVKNRVR